MNYRTPLSKARGLGSAHHGTRHWWMQRVTAVALLPLSFWLALSMARWPGTDYPHFIAWVAAPWNTILLIAFLWAGFYHAMLGAQVIIEDYLHSDWVKLSVLLSVKLLLAFLALAAVYATLRIAFTAG